MKQIKAYALLTLALALLPNAAVAQEMFYQDVIIEDLKSLTVTGDSALEGDLDVDGNAVVGGTLDVTGNVATDGNAQVGGTSDLVGDVTASGAMSVGKGSAPDAKAILDLVSTTKGVLPPRMTQAQRDAIVTPPEGLEVYNLDSKKKNVYDGSGWVEVGSGSGGAFSLITDNNSDFESNVGDWEEYADAAAATPVDMVGGAPTLTCDRSTAADIMRGAGYLLITKDAANRQGEGCALSFTIDAGDKNRRFYWRQMVETGGSYATDDAKVYAIDVDNANALITPRCTGTSKVWTCSVDLTDSLNYTIGWHVASVNASAWTIKADSITLSEEAVVDVPAPAEIVFSGYYAEAANCLWSRTDTTMGAFATDADCPGITTTYTSPKVAVTTTDVDLPRLVFSSLPPGRYQVLVSGTGVGSTGNQMTWAVTDSSTTTGYSSFSQEANEFHDVGVDGYFEYTSTGARTFELHGSATTGAVRVSMGPVAGVTRRLSFQVIRYPDASNSALLSTTELMNEVASVRAGGDPASAASGAPIIFPSETWDTHNAYNTSTGLFTAPTDGKVHVHGRIISANASINIYAYVGAVQGPGLARLDAGGEGTYSGEVEVTQGQTISIRPDGTLDVSDLSTLFIRFEPNFSVYGSVELYGVTALSERVRHFGAAVTAACTASPCTVAREIGGDWITSMTRGSTGVYTVTINTGIFDDAPACNCTVHRTSALAAIGDCGVSVGSATSITINTARTDTGVLDDIGSHFNLLCTGTY